MVSGLMSVSPNHSMSTTRVLKYSSEMNADFFSSFFDELVLSIADDFSASLLSSEYFKKLSRVLITGCWSIFP